MQSIEHGKTRMGSREGVTREFSMTEMLNMESYSVEKWRLTSLVNRHLQDILIFMYEFNFP